MDEQSTAPGLLTTSTVRPTKKRLTMFNTDSNPPATHLPSGRTGTLSRKPAQGYTLLELCVAGAIVAILMSLAAPLIGAFRAQMQLRTATNSMLSSLNFTRREAIMRNVQVVMCKSSDGLQCMETGGWEQGWIVFQDANNDRRVNSVQDVLLRQLAAPSVKITTNTPVSKAVVYNSLGISFNNGTFTVCALSVDPTEQRAIVLSAGRPRVLVPPAQPCT